MSTVLRVKRKLQDNPQEALVLLCKRAKKEIETESELPEISPSLFVFRGSVNNQDENSIKSVIPKDIFKANSSSNADAITAKIRLERKDAAIVNRYNIVNCNRGLKDNTDVNNDDVYNLVDLQKTNHDETDVTYTYDLYTSVNKDLDFDVTMLDNLVGIEHYDDYSNFATLEDDMEPEDPDDEDDSNDENNWRNDYPDDTDDEIICNAVKRIDLDDSLSSDTGEDRIYDDSLCSEDVTRYGAAYAKYKARVLTEESTCDSKNLILESKGRDVGYPGDDDDDGFYYGQDDDNEGYHRGTGGTDNDSSDEYSG